MTANERHQWLQDPVGLLEDLNTLSGPIESLTPERSAAMERLLLRHGYLFGLIHELEARESERPPKRGS